jgi:hypothetical protein
MTAKSSLYTPAPERENFAYGVGLTSIATLLGAAALGYYAYSKMGLQPLPIVGGVVVGGIAGGTLAGFVLR